MQLLLPSSALLAGPIPWLIVAEMFDSRHIDTAQSIACQVNWGFNFVVGIGFPSIHKHLGAASFIPFGFVLAATFCFVIFTLPETRGASVPEIQAEMARTIGRERKLSSTHAGSLFKPQKSASDAVVESPLFSSEGLSAATEANTKYAPVPSGDGQPSTVNESASQNLETSREQDLSNSVPN